MSPIARLPAASSGQRAASLAGTHLALSSWDGWTQRFVRIAAVGDLHYSRTTTAGALQALFAQITDAADILVLAGDLTDYGLPEEARALARETTSAAEDSCRRRARQPRLSNQTSRRKSADPARRGVVTLDGDTTEIHGIGFAGVKGFAGGFGRGALGPWGEDIIKPFVHEVSTKR